MLAEPRRKQRLSADPRNLNWKTSEAGVAKKLMRNMGWQEGEGLGKNRHGRAENLKLKPNVTGKGLGASALDAYDRTWIAHHDDFADLLASLNKGKEEHQAKKEQDGNEAFTGQGVQSTELVSRQIRRRIHYQKFTRAKDVTRMSEEDMRSVLAVNISSGDKKKSEEEREVEKKDKVKVKKDEEPEMLTVSKLSMADYFAQKMAEKTTKGGGKIDDGDEDVKPEKKSKKRRQVDKEEEEALEEVQEESTEKVKSKKKKKMWQNDEDAQEEEVESTNFKKEKHEEVKTEDMEEETEEERRARRKAEKKAAKKKRQLEEATESEKTTNYAAVGFSYD